MKATRKFLTTSVGFFNNGRMLFARKLMTDPAEFFGIVCLTSHQGTPRTNAGGFCMGRRGAVRAVATVHPVKPRKPQESFLFGLSCRGGEGVRVAWEAVYSSTRNFLTFVNTTAIAYGQIIARSLKILVLRNSSRVYK